MRDEEFIRKKVPMTKSEVRAVSVSKLELTENAVFFDIGAGTGSVSIEVSTVSSGIKVYAIEHKPEAVELIKENKAKFNRDNIEVISGEASEVLSRLKKPTHAFIGGTSGRMEKILDFLIQKNPYIRIVINVIALETLSEVTGWLKNNEIDAEIVSMQVSKAKTVASYHMMTGQNPVYIISFGGGSGIEQEESRK